MEIVYHLGAHCTDEERLLRCLLKNRGTLSQQGILVPGPARYRNLLRDTAVALKGGAASRDTQALVLEQIMDEDNAHRLILSWDSFMSYPTWALKGRIYPNAAERVRGFTNIFPDIPAEFFIGIRNPAAFLPDLFAKQSADKTHAKTHAGFFEGTDIHSLRWSDTLQAILTANPGVSLTVWSDEDTPLIWPELLQAISGHDDQTQLQDSTDLLAHVMSPEGMQRLQAYLETHPAATAALRRKVVSAFLDKFARPERLVQTIAMPGWTADTVARLTDTYERDVATIQTMPGIRFLAA